MGNIAGVNIDVGGVLSGIGALAKDIRAAVTGDISPEKKAEIQLKLAELEMQASNAQTDINLVEAQNPNLFVSGWRPFIGWTCGFAIAYHFLRYSLFEWGIAILKLPAGIAYGISA